MAKGKRKREERAVAEAIEQSMAPEAGAVALDPHEGVSALATLLGMALIQSPQYCACAIKQLLQVAARGNGCTVATWLGVAMAMLLDGAPDVDAAARASRAFDRARKQAADALAAGEETVDVITR